MGLEPQTEKDAPEKQETMAKQEGMSTEGAENKERGNWTGKLDFMLSLIGYAVGLGNLWRFPSLCYRNGGGAFLIPYLIAMLLCGMTLFFMEVAWGQFCSEGPITAWKLCPLFRGAGYAMVIISFITTIYYNVIISYTAFYLFSSFTSTVPWAGCDNWWNSAACSIAKSVNDTFAANITTNSTLYLTNSSALLNSTLPARISPAQEYWNNYVLNISDGIDNMGNIQWKLALCLLFSWVVVFLCLMKGVKSSGRVVYFTATFPYVVITILLIRGVTLPGSADGLKFFLIPKWEALLIPKVWGDAFSQIFYSLGPAWGGLLTMASYNRFHHNCLMDALIVPLVNSGTSIYAGLAIFSIVGFMSHELGVPIDKVVTSGPGLAFVAYPEALARIPLAPFWSILFFFMLFTLGLDSQFGMVEGVCSAITDMFPNVLRKRKTFFMLGLSIVSFLLGLPLVCEGGIYIFTVLDWYTGVISLFIVALVECLVIGWIYGADQFYDDIAMMLGSRPNPWWMICWKGITPLSIVFIIIMTYVDYVPVYYNDYQYPPTGEVIGWLCAAASMVMIPLVMVQEYCVNGVGDGFIERVRSLLVPTPDWGPALPQYRTGRYAPINEKPASYHPMEQFKSNGTNTGKDSEFNDISSYSTKI
ncbi:sodium- and chloride-dependent glycine transporter 1-like [Saccoglossus kowalevskii]|uniref:Sodium- and chloride-dependent glycine transporter 2-like n=1 Tax=Saccoglossus kowalevskii TaxID=10224 RepID=A0ABM0GIA6_SACKO|nr:PREDICTED: sodium- and chloride-dependent glycine transporter 2-like [Saccoglossus kowalevskii]